MKPQRIRLPVRKKAYAAGCEYYFACNLRHLRLSQSPRLSQERLAQALGVGRRTYAQYEEGKRIPPGWFIFCTANYFDVAVAELIGQEMSKERIKRHANIASEYPAEDRERDAEDHG